MADTVLVADGDSDRARRVAAAVRALAIEARIVHHGAAALEVALAEKPAVMIAQIDLPLIDGTRLAEILHANPHTCAMGILFIGQGGREESGSPTRAGRVIPPHADPDTIARFVQAMLQKRRPEPLRTAAGGATPGVEGKLSQIALAELIELFHVNRKTGVIELRQGGGRRAATGRIYLRDGDVLQARTAQIEGEKAFYRLLTWRRGTFAFREEECGEAAAIDRPTRALLREGRRQAEEWERLGSELPPLHARVSLRVARSSLPNVLHPLTQEVLLLLELSQRVRDVLDRSSYPDYQVLRTLQTLARRGMVDLRSDDASPEAPVAGLFAPTMAGRLRDWLEQGRPREGTPWDAKVVVFAAQTQTHEAFRGLLEKLPGVESTPRGEAPGVWTTARIPIDDELGIEFVEVAAAPGFAPIWPLVVHGALAALFVHGDGVEASIRALRPAIEALDMLPRARAFHVLLEDKERGGSEALCERLGLFDDRTVAAASPEKPEDAIATLRELLVRLLP